MRWRRRAKRARPYICRAISILGSAVVVQERERGGHGVTVPLQASGEGVQVRQIGCTDLHDSGLESVGISWIGHQELGEGPDVGGELGHLGGRLR
ncbi:hypothetical protein GCM10009646_01160 [Streptomyces aureus]